MNSFSFSRVLALARWDWMLNRAFYLKAGTVVLLTVQVFTFLNLARFVLDHSIGELPPEGNFIHTINVVRMGGLLLPFVLGYTFHNLHSRRSRLSELTLPASPAEKFLWHLLLGVGGVLLLTIAGVLLSALMKYVLYAVYFGWAHVIQNIRNSIPVLLEYNGYRVLYFWPPGLALVSYIAYASTYVLGNALKYKHNIAYTLAFHFLCFFVLFWVVVRLYVVDEAFFERWVAACPMVPVYAVQAVFFLIAAASIGGAYRLYTRAQLTTPRNP